MTIISSKENLIALRTLTMASILDCKKALEATNGDLGLAEKKIYADAQEKAKAFYENPTPEVFLFAQQTADHKAAAVIELRCQTEFALRSEGFFRLAGDLLSMVLAHKCNDVGALPSLTKGLSTGRERLNFAITVFRENIQVTAVHYLEGKTVVAYPPHPGRVAVLLAVNEEPSPSVQEAAHKLASQAGLQNPGSVADLLSAPLEGDKTGLSVQDYLRSISPELSVVAYKRVICE